MKNHDISNELFEICEFILEGCMPGYIHQLEELNVSVSYEKLNQIVEESMLMDTNQKCMWYADLEEIAQRLLELGIVDENECEDIIMYSRFGIKPYLSKD